MHINIDTVTVREFERTRWNNEKQKREDINPDEREYEIVAVDKNIQGIWEFAQLVEYWHRRLPYSEGLEFHFTSSSDE